MKTSVGRIHLKLPLGIGLAVLVVVAVVLIPTVAFAGDETAAEDAAVHDHAAHNVALQDELEQVRRVTARFHDLDAALEAGYELGWVNGSGNRIIAGCVAHPTAGAMATTTSTRS
jgi:hypothetical protein